MKVHLGEIPYDCDVWKMIYTDMYTDWTYDGSHWGKIL